MSAGPDRHFAALCRGTNRNTPHLRHDRLRQFTETAAYQIGEVHGYRGDKDKAFEWLERARRQHDGGLPGLRKDPLLTNLHADRRWNTFLHTMGLADDQLK